ncbi:hypothetical protein PVL29_014345 [Vitis rotundifolia]|uniref:Uncharacterized protein n=1 Tax=Vitis rotundifolia TaxID=103349 RepID=A0AA38ZGH5_VITRO|nr:hypothetical protein PVL29_014345 [Vitis rotundifolia]
MASLTPVSQSQSPLNKPQFKSPTLQASFLPVSLMGPSFRFRVLRRHGSVPARRGGALEMATSIDGYLRFHVDSKLVYDTLEGIVQKAAFDSRESLICKCSLHLIICFRALEFIENYDWFCIHNLTSLKDLTPSSPTISLAPCTIQSAYQIPISNLLVKQAAWAYLQPMPVLASSNKHFFPSLPPPTRACVVFFTTITRALNRVLGAIRGCEFAGTWENNHRYAVGVS